MVTDQERSLWPCLTIIITLFGLNLSRKACQLALHPLFGSIGSEYNFERSVEIIDLLLVPLTNFFLPTLVPSMTASSVLAAFLVWRAPDTFGRLLSSHSGTLGVIRGPLIFQSWAYWPIRLTAMSAGHAAAIKLTNQYTEHVGALQNHRTIAIIRSVSLPLVLHGTSWAMIPWADHVLNYIPACQIFDLIPAFLLASLVIGTIVELSQKTPLIANKRVNAAIILLCIVSSLLLPFPKELCREPIGWRVKSTGDVDYVPLARRLSSTGMVLVGELTLENGSQFRFLRCDHSLLGGIWIGLAREEVLKRSSQSSRAMTADEIDLQATQEAESIYPTFILQSAVRLVERSAQNISASNGKPKALMLGVGAGVSARVLMKDGAVLTVVEIDPVVYEYAQKYFGFPTPDGGIFLEDARVYLSRQDKGDDDAFDYVIHDVFTGGSVPSSLFTAESWRAIRSKLKDDGVLAVNFVGRPLSEAASYVLTTLFSVFPFCRAFSEDSGVPLSDSDYQNMVIFCSPNGKPIFKKPIEIVGFEPSSYQLQVLNSFEDHEFDLGRLLAADHDHQSPQQITSKKESFVLTDRNKALLDRAQVQNGLLHWEIMRKVLPHEVWDSYY